MKSGDLFIFDSDKTHFQDGLVEVMFDKKHPNYFEFIRTGNPNSWRYGLHENHLQFLIPYKTYHSKLYKALK